MDRDILKLMDKAMKAASAVKKCGEKKCKEQYNATLEQRDKFLADLDVLSKQVEQKKMTVQQYTKKLAKLSDQLRVSEITMALISCELQECRKQMNTSLDVVADIMSNACTKKKNKAACDQAKKVKVLRKSDKISAKQFVETQSLLAKL